ncbi:hypothetical protein [Leptospira kmetyi]|nr:hypothetical protein [Leptospira kmetyi]
MRHGIDIGISKEVQDVFGLDGERETNAKEKRPEIKEDKRV